MAVETGKNSGRLPSNIEEMSSPSFYLRAEKAAQASLRSVPKPTTGEGSPQPGPPFKKPKLDAFSFTAKEPVVEGNGLSCKSVNHNSSIISNCADVMDAQNDGAKIEDSAFSVRDCSTCGDVGFQAELFQCNKCCFRLQHTYCSNSYNPRKRWFIGLCNWCEAEVAAVSLSPRPKIQAQAQAQAQAQVQSQAHGSSKRDSPWKGSTGRMERSNAVECLLGAALRLPSAGFASVEDLVQIEPNATASAKRRKPPSFDSVEKARRSGPSSDINAKSSAALAVAAAGKDDPSPPARRDPQRSPSSSVDDGERRSLGSQGETAPAAKLKKTKSPGVASVDAGNDNQPSPTRAIAAPHHESCKRPRSDIATHPNCSDERSSRAKGEDAAPPKRRASSCDSVEKQSSTSTTTSGDEAAGTLTIDKTAKNSPSPRPGGPLHARVSGTHSPRSPAVTLRTTTTTIPEERAVLEITSHDNATRMKRSNSSADHFQRTRSGTGSKTESKENIASRNPRLVGSGSSPRPREISSHPRIDSKSQHHVQRSVETGEKVKKLPSPLSAEKPAAVRPIRDCDEMSENSKGSAGGGGSDCSIISQERWQQRQQLQKSSSRKDLSPPPRINISSKHLTTSLSSSGRHHHMRTSHIVGKNSSPSPASRIGNVAEERTTSQKKHHGKDCSTKQLRRSSSKMAGGFHNYKSLSDILC